MALPTSGPLSLADIQTEFGGSNPISLSEYYAGGTYVPAGTSGTYGAVPTSGEISLRNFYGTQKALDVQTVGVAAVLSCGKSGCVDVGYGYTLTNSGPGSQAGTISDGTFNPTGGTGITDLWWNISAGQNVLYFTLNAAVSNSGWTSMTINGNVFNRTAASFSSGSGYSTWTWSGVSSNPFGTTSGSVQAVFL